MRPMLDLVGLGVVYECPECSERLMGENRCADCGLFARRVGVGGECPHCGELVATAELAGSAVPNAG